MLYMTTHIAVLSTEHLYGELLFSDHLYSKPETLVVCTLPQGLFEYHLDQGVFVSVCILYWASLNFQLCMQ